MEFRGIYRPGASVNLVVLNLFRYVLDLERRVEFVLKETLKRNG